MASVVLTAGFGFLEKAQNQPNEQPKHSYSNSPPDKDWWKDTYAQWLMAFFSIAATGVSGWAIVLVRRTWHETKRTADAAVLAARETRKSVEVADRARHDAGEAAQKALIAARTANQITRDSVERQLRAYVSVEPLGVNAYIGVGADVVGHVRVRNVGNVPAKDIKVDDIIITWDIDGDYPIGHIIVVDESGEDLADIIGVIQPSSFMDFGSDDIPIVKKDGFLFVSGRVTYFDGFSPVRRFTEFCHRYPCARFITREGERQIEDRYARYHTSGNDAD